MHTAAASASHPPIRILHIGAGEWSRQVHAPALRRLHQLGSVSLQAICDLRFNRAEEFRQQFAYQQAFSDVETAIQQSAPHAIVCTVHPAATAVVVNGLLRHGLPLFIEKPPGISLAEASALARNAAAAQVQTLVAFNRRAMPSLRRMKQWAGAHRIRNARAEMLRTNRMEERFAVETGIHMLDALRFLLGNPLAIETRKRPYGSSAVSDATVRLQYRDNLEAEVSLLLNTGIRRETYRLTSDGASAEAALGDSYNADTSFRGDRYWQAETITEQHALTGDRLLDDGILGEYEDFLRMVNTGSPSTCTLQEAAFSMQLAEAVQNGFSGPLPPLSL